MLRWSTWLHKWLALIVGLQVLGWVVGGLVMTAIPIERVRGDHRAAAFQSLPLPREGVAELATVADGLGVQPIEATLKTTLRGTVWILKDTEGRTHVADAGTGRHVAPLPRSEVRLLAGAQYEGEGRPVAVRYFAQAPQETGRQGPLWRVDFDDAEKTSFYVSPDTGEVVSRRSDLWRFYDFFWRIHILDFKTGENFNHPVIIAAAALTLPMVLAGFVLLWIRLARDLRALRRRKA